MKFLAFNVDFSSPSHDSLSSRRPVDVGVKERYTLKCCYFIAFGSYSMKMLIIKSTGNGLFRPININDLEQP